MPWEFFLGHASHRLIAYMYRVNHPDSRVFFNTKAIADILAEAGLGDISLLLPHERTIRPDITDVSNRIVFEIKPWNEQGLMEGRHEVRVYLSALNRAMSRGRRFRAGSEFRGEILIRFALGQYIWRLEWQTTEPGVVQYRWTRSQQRFASEAAAYKAGQWVEITEQELRQYGGWVGQAVEGMVSRRERLAAVSKVVGLYIDMAGGAAVGAFTGVLLGAMSSGTKAPPMRPSAQGGGEVILFPARPAPGAPPARLPAASGM